MIIVVISLITTLNLITSILLGKRCDEKSYDLEILLI